MKFNFMLQPGKVQSRNDRTDKITPLVSIITPFYNAGKFFDQTFLCVINQTFPWYEWIIVNDGSTKKEDLILLEELSKKDSRISVYHKENGGISTARNLAIDKTATDIIIPLDADDLIIPTYIECLYWGLYFNQEYDWCYTNNVGFQNTTYLWNEKFDSERLKTYNFLVYSGAIRKKAIFDVGGYDETTKHFYEDWHLWLKLVAANKKPLKLSIYGFWYRRMDTGVLSLVNNDPKIQETAKRLIDTAAAKVKSVVEAKSYPYNDEKVSYKNLEEIEWRYDDLVKDDTVGKHNLMLLIPWMEMGGADIFNLNVVKGLDKDKYNISIITTVAGENAWRQRFEEETDEIFELPSFLDLRNYKAFINYYIKSRKIDIILLSNSYIGYYMLPWIREKYPDIIIMDYVHMEEWYWKNGGYARTSGIFQTVIDRTYTCNERTRQVLINSFQCNEDKVKTLYIGTDIHYFNPETVKRDQIYEKFNIDKSLPIILFPCRFHPQKRPFLMLEIVKKLAKDGKKFIVLAVGGGGQQLEVMERAKEMQITSKIIFTGEQEEMPEFYQDSYLTLICSLKEGIALTAFESLALATPVISTDVGGQKELITQEIGYLLPLMQDEENDLDRRTFQAAEINQFADAIEELMDNSKKYEEMCKKAREKIVAQFSIERMIENFGKEIEELSSEKYQNMRKKASDDLKQMSTIINESLLLHIENSILEKQCDRVWSERVWFQNLYHDLKHKPWKKHEGQKKGVLYRILRKIYRLCKKVWKQKIKYTFLGRMLRNLKAKLHHK